MSLGRLIEIIKQKYLKLKAFKTGKIIILCIFLLLTGIPTGLYLNSKPLDTKNETKIIKVNESVKEDQGTIEILGGIPFEKFSKDNKNVYFDGKKIDAADPKTFVWLGDSYGKDKAHVYNRKRDIRNADLETFKYMGGYYAADKENVYFAGRAIPGVNPNTFIYCGNENDNYGKDDKYVYFKDKIIKSADPKTFIHIGGHIFKDLKHVYLDGEIIPNADSFSITNIDDSVFSKDSRNVFFKHSILTGADPKTFEFVSNSWGDYYSKDAKHIFKNGEVVPGADPSKCNDENIEACEGK